MEACASTHSTPEYAVSKFRRRRIQILLKDRKESNTAGDCTRYRRQSVKDEELIRRKAFDSTNLSVHLNIYLHLTAYLSNYHFDDSKAYSNNPIQLFSTIRLQPLHKEQPRPPPHLAAHNSAAPCPRPAPPRIHAANHWKRPKTAVTKKIRANYLRSISQEDKQHKKKKIWRWEAIQNEGTLLSSTALREDLTTLCAAAGTDVSRCSTIKLGKNKK